MTDDKTQPDGLDAFFSAARSTAPAASAGLLERITQDALAEQRRTASLIASGPGWLSQIWQGLGGWPALGGLTTATLAGVWIGVNPPSTVAFVTETYLGTESAGYVVDLSAEEVFDLPEEAL